MREKRSVSQMFARQKAKKRSSFGAILMMSAASALLLNCSTTLCYDVNLYQDGKTLGKKRNRVLMTFAQGPMFESTLLGGVQWSAEEGRDVDFHLEMEQTRSWLAGAFFQRGVSRTVDVGFDAYIAASLSYGGRLFLKTGLTAPDSRWGAAIMPVLGFAVGSNEEVTRNALFAEGKEQYNVGSHAFIVELAAPLSYHFSPHVALLFGPRLYNYFYSAFYEYRLLQASDNSYQYHQNQSSHFLPGFSLGAQFAKFRTEATFVFMQDKIVPFAGVALRY